MFLSAFLVNLSCTSPKPAEAKKEKVETVKNVYNIKEEIAKGAILVDVRSPEEFASGTVEGAINIPLDEVEGRINEFKGKSGVIVFCRSGNRSGKAKVILEKYGLKNVINGINTENINAELGK